MDKIRESLGAIEGVRNVHHIHAWTLTSGKNIFSAHMLIDDVLQYDYILKKAHRILKEDFKFYFSTVQIEKECTDSGEAKHIDITKV
mgnify:CR=1 FL=1